jgi:hypothetical protein
MKLLLDKICDSTGGFTLLKPSLLDLPHRISSLKGIFSYCDIFAFTFLIYKHLFSYDSTQGFCRKAMFRSP